MPWYAAGACCLTLALVVTVLGWTPTPPPVRGLASTVAAAAEPAPPTGALPLRGRVIVLDPGHNGGNARHPAQIRRQVDAGGFRKDCNTTGTATREGYPESAFNLATALALQAKLRALGARVVLTRDNDRGWGPCVDQRGILARAAGADLLVSIHADGAAAGQSGFHVITPGRLPGYTDRTYRASLRLAELSRNALVRDGTLRPANYVGRNGLDVRTDLGTLNRSPVPSVMLESGNMHNAHDIAVLRSPAGQRRIAAALSAAIQQFLG